MDNQQHRLELIEEVSRAMKLTTDQEMASLKAVLFPSLVNSLAHVGDISKLRALESYEADWSAADYSGRTALHTAATSGNEEVVRSVPG